MDWRIFSDQFWAQHKLISLSIFRQGHLPFSTRWSECRKGFLQLKQNKPIGWGCLHPQLEGERGKEEEEEKEQKEKERRKREKRGKRRKKQREKEGERDRDKERQRQSESVSCAKQKSKLLKAKLHVQVADLSQGSFASVKTVASISLSRKRLFFQTATSRWGAASYTTEREAGSCFLRRFKNAETLSLT